MVNSFESEHARALAVEYRHTVTQNAEWSAMLLDEGRIGVAVFKDDFQTIRAFAERDNANIAHWSEFPRGGHYAALEVPEDLVADLRAFFASA